MSDSLSQEEIDRLLSGLPSDGGEDDADSNMFGMSGAGDGEILTPDEKDTLGELCNISMSTAATTLSEILSNRVEITTPNIMEFSSISDVMNTQDESTCVQIKYLSGLDSSVLFLLKNMDVAIIADLMMGGSGAIDVPELGDLQLSAVGEAMNQMMGSAASSLASIFNKSVDISPPIITPVISGNPPELPPDVKGAPVVGIVFRLKIGTIIDSELLQLMSIESAQKQVQMFMGSVDSLLQGVGGSTPSMASVGASGDSRMFGGGGQSHSGQGMPGRGMPQQPVTIQPAQFSSFDSTVSRYGLENQNLDLVLDVSLKLTVELGRSELPIKKVLELTRGSVIELDKIAGEPVDLLANGKLIAKGEVVVIEDNFGLRITSIVSPADRLKNL